MQWGHRKEMTMIEAKVEDDLFTEPNEPKKDKSSDVASMKLLGTFLRDYYNGMIKAGFTKKETMELTKTFLSSLIHDVTNNLIGGSRWTL